MSARASFEIINDRGLHARAAAALTRLAQRFPCEIVVSKDAQTANGKSIMGLLMLIGVKGTVIQVETDGPQENEALAAIGELIASRFGEPQ